MGHFQQAAGQLVDTLVLRGYLDRTVDGEDRRRLTVTRTRPGGGGGADAREKIDAELLARVGQEDVSRTRRTLAALIEMGCERGKEPPDEH